MKSKGLPKSTAIDLRGRQSVRATFKLSERAIDALSLVAFHLGIKQKSLFDHLVEDAAVLTDLAESIRMGQFRKIVRVQKTYVLSRRSLESLELISKDHDTPRDALVEYAIQRLESVILAEKKRHQIRKELFKEIRTHFDQGKGILQKSRDMLGEDDPLCNTIGSAVSACERAEGELGLFIEKSKVIEDY